ncbi:hypothetical protein CUU52_21015 [Pectobacterium polaris]|nr:hypothetical protein [Pectobacterium polaris]
MLYYNLDHKTDNQYNLATSSVTRFQHPEGLGRAKVEGDESTSVAVKGKRQEKSVENENHAKEQAPGKQEIKNSLLFYLSN